MRPALAVFMVLAVASCGPPTQTAPAPAKPAEAPAGPEAAPTTDFKRPINLLGTEPFWSLQIRPDGLKFSAPDQADVIAPNAGPQVLGEQAVWIGQIEGGAMTASLTSAICQDGMSDLLYPFKAVVEIGGRVLQGCGAYADAMPKPAP